VRAPRKAGLPQFLTRRNSGAGPRRPRRGPFPAPLALFRRRPGPPPGPGTRREPPL